MVFCTYQTKQNHISNKSSSLFTFYTQEEFILLLWLSGDLLTEHGNTCNGTVHDSINIVMLSRLEVRMLHPLYTYQHIMHGRLKLPGFLWNKIRLYAHFILWPYHFTCSNLVGTEDNTSRPDVSILMLVCYEYSACTVCQAEKSLLYYLERFCVE